MSSLRSLEVALLTSKWSVQAQRATVHDDELVQKTVKGEFKDVFTLPTILSLLRVSTNEFEKPLRDWFKVAISATALSEDQELIWLTIGVACLNAFIQVNWTGPNLDITPLQIFQLEQATDEKSLNQRAIAELSYGGEPAYHLAQHAALLRLALIIFNEAKFRVCESVPWWRLRASRIHQAVLDEPVPFPPSIAEDLASLYEGIASEGDLAGRLALEHGLLEHQTKQDRAAAELFVKAARYTGLEYELTGALGKRTKFQETDVTQLVLLAESRLLDDELEVGQESGDRREDQAKSRESGDRNGVEATPLENVPETLALNDDTLLEQTAFTSSSAGSGRSKLMHLDPSSQPALHPLDQSILLSLCLNVKNTSPSHGLTAEQMKPYVARVISHPKNWSVHTMALLLRARLEADRTRTVERSVLQLQALVDQMPTADAPLSERLYYIYNLPMPSKWELQKELALRFLTLGIVRSALEIFERLEMWEEAVKCWSALERPESGISIVRDLLEGRKEESDMVIMRGKTTSESRRPAFDSAREAKLWCLLGDLEPQNALEHYNHAWEVSGRKSGRAMRSLGGYHFSHQNFSKAIECLTLGAHINPLLSRPWFILGCSCIKEERWEEARDAFVRCVSLDEEDGESWNNLASVYLRMDSGTSEDAKSGAKEVRHLENCASII
jgi:tetratricopeptide (TPR) repeat protein